MTQTIYELYHGYECAHACAAQRITYRRRRSCAGKVTFQEQSEYEPRERYGNRKPGQRTPEPGGEQFSPSVNEALRALEKEEPLSLAEEIASEGKAGREQIHDRYEQIKQSGDTHIAELQKMSMAELIEEARKENLSDYAGAKRQDLIFRI